MNDATGVEAAPKPDIGKLTLFEILACLKAGWNDFRKAPTYGIVFSGVYVVSGLILLFVFNGHIAWVLALSLGFPLIAPFAAVGLYEVSRRLEIGEALNFREIVGVVWNERKRQIPWAGAIIVIYFLFWTFLAHMIFALFMGASALINTSTSIEAFLTPTGLAMIGVEFVVGGIVAFLLFSLTVVSLPFMLEREVDFVTGMLTSLKATRENLFVMLVWAALVAGLCFIALLPLFLGLLIVLPVLGHATWHIYRRVLYFSV